MRSKFRICRHMFHVYMNMVQFTSTANTIDQNNYSLIVYKAIVLKQFMISYSPTNAIIDVKVKEAKINCFKQSLRFLFANMLHHFV